MISIIVAMDHNDVIGKDGELPWRLRNDMKFFKEKTTGTKMVMGRKTFDDVGVLPNRETYVFTRNRSIELPKGVHALHDIRSITELEGDVFIAGGAELYEKMIPHADVMYITLVDGEFDGDTYFPKWDFKSWKLVEEEAHMTEEGHEYTHIFHTYHRR